MLSGPPSCCEPKKTKSEKNSLISSNGKALSGKQDSNVDMKICIALGFSREILNLSPYPLAMVPKHTPLTWWQNENIFMKFQVPLYPNLKVELGTGLGGAQKRAKNNQSKISSIPVCYR